MFEKAARLQLRFKSCKGLLTVEDLWMLPLTSKSGRANLDAIAVDLHQALQQSPTVSFVTPLSDDARIELQLQFDIVKHILDVKMAERNAAQEQQARAAKKQQLLGLIAQKENEELSSRSLEDLRAMVDSL